MPKGVGLMDNRLQKKNTSLHTRETISVFTFLFFTFSVFPFPVFTFGAGGRGVDGVEAVDVEAEVEGAEGGGPEVRQSLPNHAVDAFAVNVLHFEVKDAHLVQENPDGLFMD